MINKHPNRKLDTHMQEQVCYFDQLCEKIKSAITYVCVPMQVKLFYVFLK